MGVLFDMGIRGFGCINYIANNLRGESPSFVHITDHTVRIHMIGYINALFD